jgi:hypothetical protein
MEEPPPTLKHQLLSLTRPQLVDTSPDHTSPPALVLRPLTTAPTPPDQDQLLLNPLTPVEEDTQPKLRPSQLKLLMEPLSTLLMKPPTTEDKRSSPQSQDMTMRESPPSSTRLPPATVPPHQELPPLPPPQAADMSPTTLVSTPLDNPLMLLPTPLPQLNTSQLHTVNQPSQVEPSLTTSLPPQLDSRLSLTT